MIEPQQSENGQSGRNWRVGTKLIILTVPLIAVASLIAAFVEHSRTQASLQEKLSTRAKGLAHQIMADRQYYASTIVPRVAEVRAFSAGAPQSDDVTALALYYHARPPDA